MSNTLKIKTFPWGEVEAANEFIATVDLKPTGGITLRDNGIVLVYTDKREHAGMTREEHIKNTKDELARAESSLADALLQQQESQIGLARFTGVPKFENVAEHYETQVKMDEDTVKNKTSRVVALRELISNLESGKMLVGNEAIAQHFATPADDVSDQPENPIADSAAE